MAHAVGVEKMSATMDVVAIVVGFGSISAAVLFDKFYAIHSTKEIPTWLGRTIFATVGTLFILIGLGHLYFDR